MPNYVVTIGTTKLPAKTIWECLAGVEFDGSPHLIQAATL